MFSSRSLWTTARESWCGVGLDPFTRQGAQRATWGGVTKRSQMAGGATGHPGLEEGNVSNQ